MCQFEEKILLAILGILKMLLRSGLGTTNKFFFTNNAHCYLVKGYFFIIQVNLFASFFRGSPYNITLTHLTFVHIYCVGSGLNAIILYNILHFFSTGNKGFFCSF